ncbi:MAG: NDP-hexose 2,3-dehydratase family protein [Erysipelotrichales bacterium]|nr:NDP-hexose 2,3-dehydratase family protein [Erysipelotrichales bacterium]
MRDIIKKLVESWNHKDGIFSINQILDWVSEKNQSLKVKIKKQSLDDCASWYYNEDSGQIENHNGGFFTISGIQQYENGEFVKEQPIIIQNEIGYLGIICKEIDGIIHFLMQAKIEPGNVNKIQLSPTIQATKSNFTQKHGGKKPMYLDYFVNATQEQIIVDQIQSEQSSRFLKKRNRNIIIYTNDDIELFPSHKWMTLGQIKELMKIDNLVNMDTRTVLSCIPFSLYLHEYDEMKDLFSDQYLCHSIFNSHPLNDIPHIFHEINQFKMFHNIERCLVPLYTLKNWSMQNNEFVCNTFYPFKVVFCDIAIEGREVKHWTQPLFEATEMATFGLFMANVDGRKKFLVHITPEIGCFDNIEIGPTVQLDTSTQIQDEIVKLFLNKLSSQDNIRYQVILSEEGGRFYQEQNKNIIIELSSNELPILPKGYFWVDYKTLNFLQQVHNVLNIQLRNLLSLLEV